MKTFVVAANWHDYLDWCRDNGRAPHGRDLIFIGSPSKIRGYSPPAELMITSAGMAREDLPEIRRTFAVIEVTACPDC